MSWPTSSVRPLVTHRSTSLLIGTGPYKLVEFRPGDVVLYERNQNYWDAGKPFFDEVEMKGGGDAASAARAALVSGEVDFAWNLQVEAEDPQPDGRAKATACLSRSQPRTSSESPSTSPTRTPRSMAPASEPIDAAPVPPVPGGPPGTHLPFDRDTIANQLYGPTGTANHQRPRRAGRVRVTKHHCDL